MLYAKESLKDLALSGRIPGKRERGAHVLLSSIILKVCAKILGTYERLHVIEHNGKTS